MSVNQPDGYLATPDNGKGSPVLVLHAWWGLNSTIKGICDRLAKAGFIAFAPDLYHGKVTDQISGAEALANELNDAQAKVDLDAAMNFLKTQAGSQDTPIAVMGFSLGAFFALKLSIDNPDKIRSVVVFYGTGPTGYSKSKADYLGHFAESDDFEPQSNVDDLEKALKDTGRPVTFYTYPNTGHWFFEPDRSDAYHEAAAKLAWERTLAFLERTL